MRRAMRWLLFLILFFGLSCVQKGGVGCSRKTGETKPIASSAPLAPAPSERRLALVFANNRGAPGRSPLEFAESDAQKVAGVLSEHGAARGRAAGGSFPWGRRPPPSWRSNRKTAEAHFPRITACRGCEAPRPPAAPRASR